MDQGHDEGEAFDAAVIGGSFAGLSAALYLARGRRTVALLDDGLTRNRFAAHAHGFLGHDGRSPDAIRLAGRADVLAYPTVRLIEARATAVEGETGAFRIAVGGEALRARRVILAHGMRDVLPAIPGLAECWGVTAIQCPYCHGYELSDRPTGILMTGPGLPHQALILRDWSADLTVLTNGHALAPEERDALAARGVRVLDGAVGALRHEAGHLRAVALEGGEAPLAVLYLVPRAEPSSPLPADLGLAMSEGPMGPYVAVDAMQATSRPGVWAAGDLSRPIFGAVAAAAEGVMAGVACHRSLMGL